MRSPESTVSQASDKSFVAKERLSFDGVLKALPVKRVMTQRLLARLAFLVDLSADTRILDVGAAQGEIVGICQELGYSCVGIEPSEAARVKSKNLSDHIGVPITVIDGSAESIPFAAETFDVVIAASVIEHVSDANKAFEEIYRVLKHGGVFWFHTASSVCPMQNEIKHFPLFGWYPDSLKRSIMDWAKRNRPQLVGYTDTPAIHWFTPRKARRLLLKQGFRRVYDRWELLRNIENRLGRKLVLSLLHYCSILKYCADIIRQGCSYAAIK